jgi:hypothetical protein
MITDHTDESERSTSPATYRMPIAEVVELLRSTSDQDARPVFLRVKPDRRTRDEPPPGRDRRRRR